MPKSIRSPDQQGVVPAKQTDTERVADDKLNCFQSKIDGICTPEGTAACWTPLVLFYTVFYTSSKSREIETGVTATANQPGFGRCCTCTQKRTRYSV